MKLVIVEDSELICGHLLEMIATEPRICVMGVATEEEAAISLILVTSPDAVLLDRWQRVGAPQLVVTVGTRAAQDLFDANTAVPTLRVLIARNAHESLQAQTKANNKDSRIKSAVAAIVLEQPWERQ